MQDALIIQEIINISMKFQKMYINQIVIAEDH